MTAKHPEKNIAARWIQAVSITLALYLIMAMSHSQSMVTALFQGRSSVTPTELPVWLVAAIPVLPTLLCESSQIVDCPR